MPNDESDNLEHAPAMAAERLKLSNNQGTTPPWLDEANIVISVLTGEISHEISHTRSFLRYLVGRVPSEQGLTEEEISFADGEISRLERLLASLRTFKLPPLPLAVISFHAALGLALQALTELIAQQQITLRVAVPDQLCVRAEARTLALALRHLLHFLVIAVSGEGQVGVRATIENGTVGNDWLVEVWATGPGMRSVDASKLFSPYGHTDDANSGMGLAIAHRIVRSFGWGIDYCSDNKQACFRIKLPVASGGEAL